MTSALTLTPAQLQTGPAASSVGATVVNAARSQIGITYAWGGGDANGPSQGIHDGGVADSFGDYNKIGFDCSGLALYSWAKAGVTLPHYSAAQRTASASVADGDRQAGDLVFFGSPIHHVAIFTGQNNTMVEAAESGTNVREVPMRSSEYVGAGRPSGGTNASVLGSGSSTGSTGTSTGGSGTGDPNFDITKPSTWIPWILSKILPYVLIGSIAIAGIVIILIVANSN